MWSIASAQDALARHQFIKVSVNSLSTPITVQDLPQLWGEDPTAVAHTGYRIAGSAAAVGAALQAVLPADQVNAIMATMITRDNYTTTMADVYRQEQEAFTAWNRDVTIYQASVPGQLTLFNIVRQLDPSVGIGPTGQEQKKKGASKKSLAEKIASLGVGRVLDVSKLQEDGTGFKTLVMPKRLGYRFYVPSLPIISDDLTHYLRALSQLPGGYHSHLSEIAALNEHNAALASMQGVQPVSLFQILNLPPPTAIAAAPSTPNQFNQFNQFNYGAAPASAPVAAPVAQSSLAGIASIPSRQSLAFPPIAVYYPSRPKA